MSLRNKATIIVLSDCIAPVVDLDSEPQNTKFITSNGEEEMVWQFRTNQPNSVITVHLVDVEVMYGTN